MTLPLSPPSSFLLLGASTCSSVSFSVSQPKLSVPSPLGAPMSKVFSHLPKTAARFSSTMATLFLELFHLLTRSHITSCAKIRLLLTIDHGGAPKRLDMDLEDKERNQLLFVDLSYRNLLNRCRGIWRHLLLLPPVRPNWLAVIPVYPLLLASTLLGRVMTPIKVIVMIIMKEGRLPHLLSGQAPLLFRTSWWLVNFFGFAMYIRLHTKDLLRPLRIFSYALYLTSDIL